MTRAPRPSTVHRSPRSSASCCSSSAASNTSTTCSLSTGRCHLAMHTPHISHSDLKMSNLLLTSTGIVKVADFGMARVFEQPARLMSPRVVTLWLSWQRWPPLLSSAGIAHQSCCWDQPCTARAWIYGRWAASWASSSCTPRSCRDARRRSRWSAGCCMQVHLSPLQELIVRLLGAPTPAIWPEMASLPLTQSFRIAAQPYNNISSKAHNTAPRCSLTSAVWLRDAGWTGPAECAADLRPEPARHGQGRLAVRAL